MQFGTAPCVITDKAVTNLAGTVPAHPGDVLEYAVTAVNQGGNDAAGAVITDSIPANTTYVPGSLTIDGVARSDAADADSAEYDAAGRQVRFRVGAGATGTAGGNLGLRPGGHGQIPGQRPAVGRRHDRPQHGADLLHRNPISDGAHLSTSNDTAIGVVRPAIDVVKSLTGVTDRDNDQVTVGDELAFGDHRPQRRDRGPRHRDRQRSPAARPHLPVRPPGSARRSPTGRAASPSGTRSPAPAP